MPIVIEPLAEHHHDDLYAISRAAWESDVPDIPFASLKTFAAALALDWPATGNERWLALLDGVPTGYLQLRTPQLDNLDNVDVELLTAPQYRRRGVGRALWAHAEERARALGRRHLIASTNDHRPDGAAFALAVGAHAGLPETRSRLDVPPVDQARLDALLADARSHSDGYHVVRWTGVPAEGQLADLAYLDSRFNTDAPTGELSLEPEKVDADRIRANEEHRIAVGRTGFHTAAVHTATGRLVAWTVISGNDDEPAHAWQQITLVDPPHRGRRLGLLIKLENLRYIRGLRPELAGIDTFNATANRQMLAINDVLGFRPVDRWIMWQRSL